MNTTPRRVIGTRTGKIRHLMVESLASVATGYAVCGKWVRARHRGPDRRHLNAVCGKWVRDAVEQDSTVKATCQKCLDEADLAEGKPNHALSITDLRSGAEDQWIGSAGSCSCGGWSDQVLKNQERRIRDGGPSLTIVTNYYAHVIASVRAARQTTTPEEG
jgi:hypothetical protein